MGEKAYIRCMGGSRCNHLPGTCTASAEYQAKAASMAEQENPAEPTLGELIAKDEALIAQLLSDANATNTYGRMKNWAEMRSERREAAQRIRVLSLTFAEAETALTAANARAARQRELIEDAVPILEVLVADRETLIGEECEIARDLQARFLAALDPQPEQGEG